MAEEKKNPLIGVFRRTGCCERKTGQGGGEAGGCAC